MADTKDYNKPVHANRLYENYKILNVRVFNAGMPESPLNLFINDRNSYYLQKKIDITNFRLFNEKLREKFQNVQK